MGLTGFFGHRLLAIFLVMVAIAFFLTPSLAYAQAGQMHLFGPISAKEYLFYFLGLVSAIASVYFFKTQH